MWLLIVNAFACTYYVATTDPAADPFCAHSHVLCSTINAGAAMAVGPTPAGWAQLAHALGHLAAEALQVHHPHAFGVVQLGVAIVYSLSPNHKPTRDQLASIGLTALAFLIRDGQDGWLPWARHEIYDAVLSAYVVVVYG